MLYRTYAGVIAILVGSLAAEPLADTRQAVAALKAGDSTAAERILRNELKAHPSDAAAIGLLAVALDGQKKYLEAAECYRRALAMTSGSVRLLNNFGNHLLATGDPAGARNAFRKVVAADPHHENANLQLAGLALQDRQPAEALRAIGRLATEARESAPALLLRMRTSYLSGRVAEGDASASRLAGISPRDPRLDFSVGLALAAAERFEKAESFFSRALEAAPADFDAQYNLGLAALHAGHAQRAQQALAAALSRRPEDPDVLYNLALARLSAGQKEAAIALLAQASRIAPERPALQQLLARAAMDLAWYADAAIAWDNYLRLAPQDDAARRERGFALALSGHAARGLDDLNWYVAAHPDDAIGFYELGAAQTNTAETRALADLDRALALNPDLLPARFSRAIVYHSLEKPDSALPDLEFCVAREPENLNALEWLGRTYSALDRFQDAVPVLRKAASLAPGNSRILFHLSRALNGAGQGEEARSALERYRQMGPDMKPHNPSAGMVAFLSLPPEDQEARYRARLRDCLESDPNNPLWQFEQLRLLLRDGKTAEAAALAPRFLASRPPPSLLSEAGRALIEAEQYSLAKDALAQAAVRDSSADVLLSLAIASFHADGPQPALEQMARIPEAQRSGDYYLARAILYEASGATDQADSDLQRAFRDAPTRFSLYRSAALLLIERQRIDTVVKLTGEGSRALPDEPSMLLLNASALEMAQRTEDAQRLLERIRRRWPEWTDAYVVSGMLLASHGRFADARAQLETAQALGAAGAAVSYYLAECLVRISPGSLEVARKEVERALEFAPSHPWAQALAGRIAFEGGQYEVAATHLREAVRLRPDLLRAHDDLAKTYAKLGRKADEQAEIEQARAIRERLPVGIVEPEIAPFSLLGGMRTRPGVSE